MKFLVSVHLLEFQPTAMEPKIIMFLEHVHSDILMLSVNVSTDFDK